MSILLDRDPTDHLLSSFGELFIDVAEQDAPHSKKKTEHIWIVKVRFECSWWPRRLYADFGGLSWTDATEATLAYPRSQNISWCQNNMANGMK